MTSPQNLTRVRVLFDATRLVSRGNDTPTGIDRVDLAYVTALASSPDIHLRLVLFNVFGPQLLSPGYSRKLIESTVKRWQLGLPRPGSEQDFAQLCHWLNAPLGAVYRRTQAAKGLPAPARKGKQKAIVSRRLPWRVLSKPTVYVNTSHGRLYRKSISRWLRATRTPSAFFVHDLIPVNFPQFNRRAEPARHATRLRTISAHAKQVLVNSRATEEALTHYLKAQKLRRPPVQVAPLGMDQTCSSVSNDPICLKADPYFVVLGTIEPRKNHQLLLDIWSGWLRAQQDSVPRLVILGRRGWRNEAVFRQLDDFQQKGAHVAECSDLSDAHVSTIIRRARALLCPSFAEGFSLPVVEALALGTPVIASDIPAHAEVDQGCAERIDPLARSQWAQTILDYAQSGSLRRAAQVERIAKFAPFRWSDHFGEVLPSLIRCARGK